MPPMPTCDPFIPGIEQFGALRRLLLKLRGPHATSSADPGREGAAKAVTLARIVINMERWRWLPPDLGEFHVWNNVPEFLTRVVRRGETVHTDKIVAGQPDWVTPAFSADMKMIVFHPSWGMPDGIRRKELWPRLRETSQGGGLLSIFTGSQSSKALLDRYNLQVTYQGRPIDPDKVDWSTANIGAYEFRQPPGPTNPLGKLKFMFPNKHNVYMHDTTASERDLFGKSYRGFSHGCMRVSDPRRLAVILLGQDKGWSEEQVESLLNGGATREVKLTTRIPVHMTYFTAMVDGQGNLQTFADLYGLDARMGADPLRREGPVRHAALRRRDKVDADEAPADRLRRGIVARGRDRKHLLSLMRRRSSSSSIRRLDKASRRPLCPANAGASQGTLEPSSQARPRA